MNVFDLAAVLTLNKKDYDKGLDDAEEAGSKFGKGLKTGAKVAAGTVAAVGAAATATGAAIVKGTKEVSEYGDNVDKMSQKLGLYYEGFQEWDYVLSQAGTDINSMQTGLKTLTNKLDEAKNGSADAKGMFEQLGLSMEDLNSMSREDVFESVITGFQQMEDSTERAALANDLFGKSGQNLTPLFNSSVENTEKLRQAAHSLGMVMSDDAVKASAAYQDSLDTFQRTTDGLKRNLMGSFMPGVTEVMDGLTAIFAGDDDKGVQAISQGLNTVVKKMSAIIPVALEIGTQIITALAEAIIDNLPELAQSGIKMISKVSGSIIKNLPKIIEAGLQVLLAVAQGISDNLPELIPSVVDSIVTIAETLTKPENLLTIINAGIEIIVALIVGIAKATPRLLEGIKNVFVNIGTAIGEKLGELYIQYEEWINGVKEKVKTWFDNALEKVKTWAKDLVDNFLTGLKGSINKVVDFVKGIAQKIKDLLGFSEPKEGPLSDFHTYAPDMLALFEKGLKDNEDDLRAQVASTFDFSNLISSPEMSISTAGTGYAEESSINADIRELLMLFKTGKAQTSSTIENTRELGRAIYA